MYTTEFNLIGSKTTEVLNREMVELVRDMVTAEYDSTKEVLRVEILRRKHEIDKRAK